MLFYDVCCCDLVLLTYQYVVLDIMRGSEGIGITIETIAFTNCHLENTCDYTHRCNI